MFESPGKVLLKVFLFTICATFILIAAMFFILSTVPEESQTPYILGLAVVFLVGMIVPGVIMYKKRRGEMIEFEKKYKAGEVSQEEYQKVQGNKNKYYKILFITIAIFFVLQVLLELAGSE